MSQRGTHLVSVEIPLGLALYLLEHLNHGSSTVEFSETERDFLVDALKDAISNDDA